MASIKGQRLTIIQRVIDRDAAYLNGANPGITKITLESGANVTAVMDPLGGNVLVQTTTPLGEPVHVMLALGEYR